MKTKVEDKKVTESPKKKFLKMGVEEITIGKIKSPDVFYYIPCNIRGNDYKRQVKEMFQHFNREENERRQKSPPFIKRLIMSGTYVYTNTYILQKNH